MKSQDYGIDVLEIIKHLVNRGWIIVLCTVIAAVGVMPVMGLMPQKSQMQALLAAMDRTEASRIHRTRFRRRAMIPVAAAAGIAGEKVSPGASSRDRLTAYQPKGTGKS